jgi:hypothetical protein
MLGNPLALTNADRREALERTAVHRAQGANRK